SLGDALRDDGFQSGQERQPLGSRERLVDEARGRAQMTGRSTGPGGDQQRVAIAVGVNLRQLEAVARGFSLLPQTLLAAAEVLDCALTPGGHQRHVADLPYPAQLLDVITASHAIASHGIEDDLAGAAP